MIIGWFKNVISHMIPNAMKQGVEESEKEEKARLMDVAEGAAYLGMDEDQKQKTNELLAKMKKSGAPTDAAALMATNALRRKIREKVRKNLNPELDIGDTADEVTERITEAALQDEHIRRLFS